MESIGFFTLFADKFLAVILLCLVGWWWLKNFRDFRIRLCEKIILAFMLSFLGVRLLLYFSFFPLFSSLSFVDLFQSFLVGIRYDLCVLGAFGGLFLLAVLLPVQNKRYYQIICALAAFVWSVALWLCVGDLIYFSFVKRHTGSEILLAIYDLDLLVSLATSRYAWVLLMGSVLSLLGIGFAWHWSGKVYQPPHKLTWKEILCLLSVALLIFFAFRGQFGFRLKPLTVSEAYADGNLAAGNLALNGAFCIYKSLSKKYVPLSETVPAKEALQRTRNLFSSKQEQFVSDEYPLLRVRKQFNASGKDFNVVILLVESWMYSYTDALSGSHYGATPVLDELVKKSLVFDNFYASGQRSINGAGTIMSGLPQLQGLPYFSLGLESYHFAGLAQLLNQAGYDTFFAQPSDWNSARVGLVAQLTGFQNIYSKDDMSSIGNYINQGKISDYDGLMFLAERIKKTEKPFFAFFFTAAMHPPFAPLHADFQHFAWNGPDKGYLNTLNYTDWAIGQFIDLLKKQGQLENTVLILVADHTLGWGESGTFQDRFHIPLLIYAPRLFAPERLTRVGGQADLFPTVLDILNISLPYAAAGNSLLDTSARHFAFTSQDGRVLGWMENQTPVEHTGKAEIQTGNSHAPEEEIRDLLGFNRALYDRLTQNKWYP